MLKRKPSRQYSNYSFWLLNAAAYLTWLGIVVAVLPVLASHPNRTIILVLFGLFFVGLSVYPFLEARPFQVHLYLLFQLIVAWGITSLLPSSAASGISTFFFILSAQAMLFLPLLPGLIWIVAFIVVTWLTGFFAFGAMHGNDFVAIMGGYLFFGTFGAGLRQANEARQHSQKLLADLQEAHEQLQAYTSQAQQLAVAEERNRLAREMHDALGHRLTVAVVQLEGAQRLIPTDPERSASMIEAMRTQLKQALAELRQTVSALRSPAAAVALNGSLEAAVTHLVQTFQEATGLSIDLTMPEELPLLPEPHRLALYRAAQESLTNVQRHANARQAWLIVAADATHITLTVSDDGQGFGNEAVDGRFGLIGLRERAKQLSGTLTLGAADEGGARVIMQLPVPMVEAADA
jgi:signal transduction histidine kinase